MTIAQRLKQLKTENDPSKLNEFHLKYEELFKIHAGLLCWQIVKVFNVKEPSYKVNPVFQALSKPPYNTNEQKDFSENRVSVSLAVNKNDKIKSIFLAKDLSVPTEEAFDKKLFTVDVFDLLINDELEFSEVIHAGCWKAVAENLKLKLEHTTNTEQDI